MHSLLFHVAQHQVRVLLKVAPMDAATSVVLANFRLLIFVATAVRVAQPVPSAKFANWEPVD